MHDSRAVGVMQGARNLRCVPEDVVGRQCTMSEPVVQRFALEVLQDKEHPAVVFPDIEKRTDVGVLKRGDSASFHVKALPAFRVMRERSPVVDGLVIQDQPANAL
jgi:hypothetical protein